MSIVKEVLFDARKPLLQRLDYIKNNPGVTVDLNEKEILMNQITEINTAIIILGLEDE